MEQKNIKIKITSHERGKTENAYVRGDARSWSLLTTCERWRWAVILDVRSGYDYLECDIIDLQKRPPTQRINMFETSWVPDVRQRRHVRRREGWAERTMGIGAHPGEAYHSALHVGLSESSSATAWLKVDTRAEGPKLRPLGEVYRVLLTGEARSALPASSSGSVLSKTRTVHSQ